MLTVPCYGLRVRSMRRLLLALTGSGTRRRGAGPLAAWSRLKARLRRADLLLQRLAGTVFLIRVAAAMLAYGSQVLFARWMGTFEFGIYVYVWTWVLLIGQSLDLGLATAAQRFIPEYRERELFALLRGYVVGSRWLAVGIAIGVSALAPGSCGCCGRGSTTTPSSRSTRLRRASGLRARRTCRTAFRARYDWVALGIVPTYIFRQICSPSDGRRLFAGLPIDAVTAMVLSCVAIWLPALGQMWCSTTACANASRRARRRTMSSSGSPPRCRS